jgi:hypothetical protein
MAKFNYKKAKQAGYSDEEISTFLAKDHPKFNFEKAKQSGYSSSEINEFLSKPEEKTSTEKALRVGAQYGLGVTDTAMLPLTIQSAVLEDPDAQHAEFRKGIFEDIERLAEQKQSGDWDQQDEALFQELQEQIKHPEKAQRYVKIANISPSGLIKKGVKETTGYDLEPEGFSEHTAEIAGNLFKPKTIVEGVKNLKDKAFKMATKEGRQALKVESQWKSLEKAAKGDQAKQEILDFSKSKNLTPEEATLLLQTSGKVKTLEKISKKSKRFKGIVSGLNKKLSNSYEELKNLGKQGGYLDLKEVNALQDDLGKILTEIDKTFIEGPDTISAKKVIEEGIKKLNNKAGTVEDLINSRRNIRQSINWKNVNEGDYVKRKAEKAFLDAIERKNPRIAKSLRETDKAWAKYEAFEKMLKKESVVHIKGVPVPGFMGALLFSAAGYMTAGIPGAAKVLIAKELIQRLSTRLLTDPKFQSIHKKMLNSIKSGSQKDQRGLLTAFLKVLEKEDPELYEEFNNSVVESKSAE